jgi:ribonuclease HII
MTKLNNTTKPPLETCFDKASFYEIGVDEAGRGPMFGRLYVGAVVLPKGPDSGFHHEWMKDSKRFTSKKKIRETAEYIKQNALSWSIQYIEADVIDEINIRQAVFRGMHAGIKDVMQKMSDNGVQPSDPLLLIDGNDFKPYTIYTEDTGEVREIPSTTIEGGDNKYTSIAAASILAKVARDDYIAEMCTQYPELVERYSIDKNMGYGTPPHMAGIRQHGITQWHRRSYGLCKTSVYAPLDAMLPMHIATPENVLLTNSSDEQAPP